MPIIIKDRNRYRSSSENQGSTEKKKTSYHQETGLLSTTVSDYEAVVPSTQETQNGESST